MEKNGHTGLPDRDLLAQLVPKVRTATPSALFWEQTDGTVRDHYWLRTTTPKRGARVDANLTGQKLMVTTQGATGLEVLLDARLCDLGKELEVVVDGAARKVTPQPSLRVLCSTLRDRGDGSLAASVVLPLP